MAETWLAHPPSKDKRYKKLHYPSKHDGRDIANGFVLDAADPREAYEISHLPGVGAYALDSYRIFHRDRLRGLSTGWRGEEMPEGCEPEWRRVVPQDKELRAFLKWLWFSEGWDWDAETGARRPV
jgi:methyl-CpG-binding domain protein 4